MFWDDKPIIIPHTNHFCLLMGGKSRRSITFCQSHCSNLQQQSSPVWNTEERDLDNFCIFLPVCLSGENWSSCDTVLVFSGWEVHPGICLRSCTWDRTRMMMMVTIIPLRYLFLGFTQSYTIFWVLIRLSQDICDISHLVKYARKLQELRHYREIRFSAALNGLELLTP